MNMLKCDLAVVLISGWILLCSGQGADQSPCTGLHSCHHFATCYPGAGSDYTCRCDDGFFGDGSYCGRIDHCDGACHQNARCLMTNEKYKCVCNDGYSGSGFGCRRSNIATTTTTTTQIPLRNSPIPSQSTRQNPCASNRCHENAACFVGAGGEANCICNNGYTGNGEQCSRDQIPTPPPRYNCGSTNCHEKASCYLSRGVYFCLCNTGYSGNGKHCYKKPVVTPPPVRDPCVQNICHEHATCSPSGENYKCLCNDGYIGNGLSCSATVAELCQSYRNRCHQRAACVVENNQPKCKCNPGYQGDGQQCTFDQCHNNVCHKDAICHPNYFGGYRCLCSNGFHGNGRECHRRDPCESSSCHAQAACIPSGSNYRCDCNTGYVGDGFTCSRSCQYKCGESYLQTLPCQCHYGCERYGNCCTDYSRYCQQSSPLSRFFRRNRRS